MPRAGIINRNIVSRAEGGFTLLEMLVAMMLLGLIMVMIFGGLRLGLRVWKLAKIGLRNMPRLPLPKDSCVGPWRAPIP